MQYALMNGEADILDYRNHDSAPPRLAPEKGLRWLPVVNVRADLGENEIRLDAPEVAVEAERVVRTWGVRPKTYAERLTEIHAARRGAYPAIGDQLDAAFKARSGEPADLAAIDAAIATVKAAHPKPAV